jgi:hypothetical protein
MSETKNRKTEIMIAIIALIIVISVVIITNRDKLFPSNKTPPVNADPQPQISPTAAVNLTQNNVAKVTPNENSVSRMVGTWQAIAGNFPLILTLHSNLKFEATVSNGLHPTKIEGNWAYANGIYSQTALDRTSTKGKVKWIDEKTFELTITETNGARTEGTTTIRYTRTD